MKKLFLSVIYFLLLITLGVYNLGCASIDPIMSDVCTVSNDVCTAAGNACSNVPPNWQPVCDVAGEVCNYASLICSMFPGSDLPENVKENIYNELQTVKNALGELKTNKPLSFNDSLEKWKLEKSKLQAIYNTIK